MSFCTQCGTKLSGGAFCTECGAAVGGQQDTDGTRPRTGPAPASAQPGPPPVGPPPVGPPPVSRQPGQQPSWTPSPPPKKNMLPLLVGLVAGVLLLAVGGIGALMITRNGSDDAASGRSVTASETPRPSADASSTTDPSPSAAGSSTASPSSKSSRAVAPARARCWNGAKVAHGEHCPGLRDPKAALYAFGFDEGSCAVADDSSSHIATGTAFKCGDFHVAQYPDEGVRDAWISKQYRSGGGKCDLARSGTVEICGPAHTGRYELTYARGLGLMYYASGLDRSQLVRLRGNMHDWQDMVCGRGHTGKCTPAR